MSLPLRAASLLAAACGLIFASSAGAERITTEEGDRLEISYSAARRLIYAGIGTERIKEPVELIETFFPDLVRMIAREADTHGYPRFAITGIFCIRLTELYSIETKKMTCKLQAAPLNRDEKVVPSKKDDVPAYFDTESVLANYPGNEWVRQFDIGSGIRGTVDIKKMD